MSLSASIARRVLLASRHANNPLAQRIEKENCRRSVVHFVNDWCWTFDPRIPATLPFDLFARQFDFLVWLDERKRNKEWGICEKSRDMGLTWLCAADAVHDWLFRQSCSIGFGSRKETLVDKMGDPDSILEKIRIILDNLPPWLLPEGYSRDKHANFCKIVNPENGNTITGEAGDEIGRGGRKFIYFVDEAAFLEHPQSIDGSLSQTTNVRIDVSTPNGPGNPFAQKRFSGKYPVFTFHWRDDPRKDDRWYEEQKARLEPVVVAQEIDIDYTASIEGICIPAIWVRASVDLELPEPLSSPIGGMDISEEGDAKTVIIHRKGPVVKPPMFWQGLNTHQTAMKAADEAERLKISNLFYDVVGVGLGVKGTWTSAGRKLKFTPHPINTGESPSNMVWETRDYRTSKELFINKRAELWWLMRLRFEKTYEYVTQGIKHPPDELISLPNHPQLIAELSMPLAERRENGKLQLESKKAMRKRGVKSPDFADALVLAFTPKSMDKVIRLL